jgi:pimeloyl-ACP methyl ester carboxylesterase
VGCGRLEGRCAIQVERRRFLIGKFVLVHGGELWRPICDLLEAAGHKTYAPSLIGYGERMHLVRPDLHLDDHVQDLVELVNAEALSDVVLVGHSYGGMVLTGAAEQLADRIRHLVYVDALAPRDGDSALSISPAWRRDEILEEAGRWAGVWVPFRSSDGSAPPPGIPLQTLTDPVRLTNPRAAALPRTFVYCSKPPAPMIGPSAERARTEPGWTFHEFRCGHIVQHEAPHEPANVLLGATDAEPPRE